MTDNTKQNLEQKIDKYADRASRRHFTLTILWIMGVVLAKGFWSTFFAFLFPFWGWYVAVEFLLHYFKLV